jgi:hypothetical protein
MKEKKLYMSEPLNELKGFRKTQWNAVESITIKFVFNDWSCVKWYRNVKGIA